MSKLKDALNCDRSIFIQACAGAGKTFALTKRYAAILDRFAQEFASGTSIDQTDHKSILVITFTKKAAGEMKKRIYQDLNVLLSGKEIKEMKGMDFCPFLRKNDASVHDFTNHLRDTFSQNSISTIDSFCTGILREFAHKIDLDPQFIPQDENESQKLLDESLEKWLRLQVAKDPHCFDLLLNEMTFNQIRRSLKKLYHSREVLSAYTSHFKEKNDDEIWQDWLENYTPAYNIDHVVSSFEALWEQTPFLCSNENDALFQGIKNMYIDLQGLDRENAIQFKARFISEVLKRSIFVTGTGTFLKKKKGLAGNWSDKKEAAETWLELLKNSISEDDINITPSLQDKKIIPLMRDLITRFEEFDSFYFSIRKQRNVLDFSDIIIETHKLVTQHVDVRKQLGKRYRHIMLDEFQDTNPLRWNIIKSIFSETHHAKLFIVGDRKQSIYRFNNADVTVMNDAENLIKKLNGDPIDFNENYRSSKIFVEEGINALISKILPPKGEDKEEYEADFEPTTPIFEKESISPALEFFWCNEPDEKDEEYLSALHAAQHVKHLLSVHENTSIDKEGEALIGVLFRKFTHITDYLQAFRQLDIPIHIVGGKGFFETPAVRDIYHFLSVLDNPYDDLALVGLLRSPFIALSDPEIHVLSKRDKKSSLFDAMNDHVSLHETKSLILSWIEDASYMPLDELLTKVLDQEDRELGYVSELLPQQQLANLDKAINIIRGMQRSGNSLRSIREFFAYQINQKSNEAQASYPGTAKVHLLTVHKAKGLEYPIVVIPEMNSKGNAEKDNVRFGRTGNAYEIALSLSDQEKPGLSQRLKEMANREEEAEDKRIFYVALTRAIYKVCLLGEGKKAMANTWWDKFVLKPYGLEEKEQKDPENWPSFIKQENAENVKILPAFQDRSACKWEEAPHFKQAGAYLYRTPHDFMGQDNTFESKGERSGLGTAPGSLFHACIENNWFDLSLVENNVNAYIQEQFPNVDKRELILKVNEFLGILSLHPLYNILKDPTIEQYREISLKGWLKNEENVVQVNGTIDLLYHYDEQWVILDFKTDSSMHRKDAYAKQIRTYQWMLKQAYGIDAIAKIFFVSLNEMLDVAWDDNYFNDLPFESQVFPELPVSHYDPHRLIEKIGPGEQLVLCSSSHHEEQLFLGFVKAGIMRPNIHISTLSKWVNASQIQCLSQDRLRLMIQKNDKSMKNGMADFLAKAFRDHELQKGELRREFLELYGSFTQDKGYRAANLPYEYTKIPRGRILLVDLPPLMPLEKKLLDRAKDQTDIIDISQSDKINDVVKYSYIEAFSPREEALAVAEHIRQHATSDDDILITVSSLDKYAPHLKRLFPQLGLSVRFIGPKPLQESPITTLCMDVINMSTFTDPSWAELAPILLHPWMQADENVLNFDKDKRQKPWEERMLPEKATKFIEDFHCRDAGNMLETIQKFIDEYNINSACNMDMICEKFMDILSSVSTDLHSVHGEHSVAMLYQEMKMRILKESVPRKDQANGIPVVGYLDSLGALSDKLYVMGMVEGDIPRPENENPCLIRKEKFSLELNHHFMTYWRSLGDRVVFSSSQHAEDGAEQNRSTFLEDIDLEKIQAIDTSRRNDLLHYDNCFIDDDRNELILRHNEITSGLPGPYSGDVKEQRSDFNLSVTTMDTLLACPMRYYFDKILYSLPMDEDERTYWVLKKGTIVHSIMEQFAKEQGFSLDLSAQIDLLDKTIQRVFLDMHIDTEDPFHMDHFRYITRDLNPGSQTNAFVKILQENAKSFQDYDIILTETGFDQFEILNKDVKVSINGRIDKIMIDEDMKCLVASDYKTGTIKTNRLKFMLLSQLYLYLKKCKEDYPEHEMMAVYEVIKDIKDTKIVKFAESEGSFIQVGPRNTDKGFNIEEFEAHLEQIFSQISEGKYYITDKPFKEACEYCTYEGLCRKSTRLKSNN